jgi:hypothetical protein
MKNLRSRRPLLLVGISLALLFLGVKLFTARFQFRDDPTTGLLLRGTPSLVSDVVLSDFGNHRCYLADENSFRGEGIHRAVTGFLWWMPLAGIALFSALRMGNRLAFAVVVLGLAQGALLVILADKLATAERVDLSVHWLLPLPLLAAFGSLLGLFRGSLPRWLAIAALALAVAFSGFLAWGNRTGRMVPYEVWVKQEW